MNCGNVSAMTTKLRGLIFDFDGTIANSLGDALGSFNYALAKLGEAPRTGDEIKRYFGMGADRIFTQLLGDRVIGLRAFELYKEHQRSNVHQVVLHEGIYDLLERLAKASLPLGIVTGRHSEDLEILLSHHQLRSRFVAIISDDHVENSKPAPDGLHLALKQMKLVAADAAYVGDSVGDMEAAHAAGMIAIAALWDPLVNRAAMEACKPHVMATTPADVDEAFR